MNFLFSQRLQAFLRSGTPLKHISNVDLAAFPKFLRFKDVELSYNYFFSEGSIEKKCELFQKYLQQLSPALNDSNLIVFDAYINKGHQHYFSSHLQLVDHLRQQLLPICDSSRGYTFEICFYSGKSEASAVIESILQLPQIEHCSHVELVLCYANPTALPVQAIAEWLNRECNRTGVTGPKCKEKFLKISLDWIQNLVEMCGHLTEVRFIYHFLFFNTFKIQNKNLFEGSDSDTRSCLPLPIPAFESDTNEAIGY